MIERRSSSVTPLPSSSAISSRVELLPMSTTATRTGAQTILGAMTRRRGLVTVLAALACGVAPASAGAAFPGTALQRLSSARDGGPSHGPARNPAISQDRRWARLAAFESDATD